MKQQILLFTLALTGLATTLSATGCSVYSSPPPDTEVVAVAAPPPPPPAEVEIIPASPGAEYSWIGGYQRWDGRRYVWIPGHYDRSPQREAHYVHGHWEHRGRVTVWVDGHWA